jgi:hypothetical protein
MTMWRISRAAKTVLSGALMLGAMGFAAPPAGAATAFHAVTPMCGPKNVTQQPSPGVGKQATYSVDAAGTVSLLEQSTTTLQVTDADGNAGWTATVLTASGTKVHVGFQQVGAPEEQERFWARLNTKGTAGTEAILVLQSCT